MKRTFGGHAAAKNDDQICFDINGFPVGLQRGVACHKRKCGDVDHDDPGDQSAEETKKRHLVLWFGSNPSAKAGPAARNRPYKAMSDKVAKPPVWRQKRKSV